MQISSMLMRLNDVSVIAHQAIRNRLATQPDYKELNSITGITHIITGGVQVIKTKLRGNIQLIECTTYKQLLSEAFERKLTHHNYFNIQDEIAHCVLSLIDEMNTRRFTNREPIALPLGM
jgi:TolB-like protein